MFHIVKGFQHAPPTEGRLLQLLLLILSGQYRWYIFEDALLQLLKQQLVVCLYFSQEDRVGKRLGWVYSLL